MCTGPLTALDNTADAFALKPKFSLHRPEHPVPWCIPALPSHSPEDHKTLMSTVLICQGFTDTGFYGLY